MIQQYTRVTSYLNSNLLSDDCKVLINKITIKPPPAPSGVICGAPRIRTDVEINIDSQVNLSKTCLAKESELSLFAGGKTLTVKGFVIGIQQNHMSTIIDFSGEGGNWI